MKFFDFTKSDYEYIVNECMLDEELAKIFEMKIKGYSITKIALELNMSESSVDRSVKQLKKKIAKIL